MTMHLPISKQLRGTVNLPLSKSLFNRLLVLQACYPTISLPQKSVVDDINVLQRALSFDKTELNIGAAGTAMRFATAYFAASPGKKVVLRGSERMHQRPIGVLVEALKQMGAQIDYVERDGFPPLKITGKALAGGALTMAGNVSSQFITALLLVAPTLQNGLNLALTGQVVSQPYINMTIGLMRQLGFEVEQTAAKIKVKPTATISPVSIVPEADWSAAAFWYGWAALCDDAEIELQGLTQNSLQGDKRIATIFEELGVKTTFTASGVKLTKRPTLLPAKLVVDLLQNPDLAQPIAFTCALLGIGADLRGLQTLPNKETDRLQAMKTELAKIGVEATITKHSLAFEATRAQQPTQPFVTYQDHRMAMAVALVSSRFEIGIQNPEVISKSYPNFWIDLAALHG